MPDLKQWTKPALLVLMRNKPEEVILHSCKTSYGATGFTSGINACGTITCGPCPDYGES
jgi:hypothetical protein